MAERELSRYETEAAAEYHWPIRACGGRRLGQDDAEFGESKIDLVRTHVLTLMA